MSTDLRQLLRRARIVDLSYPLTAEFPLFPVYGAGAVAIVGAPALAGGSGGPTRVLAAADMSRPSASRGRDEA